MSAQNPRKTGAKLPGDFADIQVRNCFGPYYFSVVPLVVFGHGLARVARNLLPVFSGFLVQVQRQCSHFVEARHFLFLPSLVTLRRLPSLFEGPRQIPLFNLRPVIFRLASVRSHLIQGLPKAGLFVFGPATTIPLSWECCWD